MPRRILRTLVVAVVATAFAACSNPFGPSGKLPTQPRTDVINPNADVINPNADVINPNADVINPNANRVTTKG